MSGCCNMRVVTCGPNEALVISGVFYGNRPLTIVGGRAVVFPCIQLVQKLPLNTMTLEVKSPTVYTSQGVPISVTGVAQVKINATSDDLLRTAAEQFGSKSIKDIEFVARETLEGHQRAIMGCMTVEQIYRERKTFSAKVFEVAKSDFLKLGLMIVSYTLKDISDEVGYLKALGQPRTAQVLRDARIGEASANMESGIAEAKAEMERIQSDLVNKGGIAKSKRDFDLTKAGYDYEVNTASAEAELAYRLQAAMMKQKIMKEEMEVKVVERLQEIQLHEQEILRKSKEVESAVRKPAEAEKYRLETIAEAMRLKEVLEAEAKAEAIALRGEAEAFAIEIKAKAEAEQMAKKADAWNAYGKAAVVDMTLQMLPKVAAKVAAPLSKAKKVTMVSDGQGQVGAAKMVDEVIDIMVKVPGVVKSMIGVDVFSSVAKGRPTFTN